MIDPELAAVIELLPNMDLVDPVAARQAFEEILVAIRFDIPGIETLDIEDRMVPGWEDDPDVSVRVYRPASASASASASATARVPGILMIHGGGFVIGSVDAEHAGAALTTIDTGAVVISVDYRLAPEHPYPAGLHDCYAALRYMHAEADALGVDPERVALIGASAGGGWRRRRRSSPATGAARPSASSCCRSPSSTTGCRPRPCRPSWTPRCGTGRWPCRVGRRISVRCTDPTTCRPTRRRRGPTTSRAAPRLHLDGRERPAARRGDHLRPAPPAGWCLGGAAPVPRHLPRLCAGDDGRRVQTAQRESALALRQALGVD